MDTAAEQVKLATDDEELRFKALSEFTRFLASNFSKENTPAYLGSERSRIIKELTFNPDPYAELKERANRTAADLRPFAEQLVAGGKGKKERLKRALKIAAAANSIEFGVSEYEFDPELFRSEFEELLDKELKIDDSAKIASRIISCDEVTYLLDNCGEIILDQVLMSEIRDAGTDLFIGAKTKPVQEDVTSETAKEIGIGKFGKIISAGEKVGIFPQDISSELQKKLECSDLVISKGMGNFETISEFEEDLEGRLVYLLRAKCSPVAENFRVRRGELVLRFL